MINECDHDYMNLKRVSKNKIHQILLWNMKCFPFLNATIRFQPRTDKITQTNTHPHSYIRRQNTHCICHIFFDLIFILRNLGYIHTKLQQNHDVNILEWKTILKNICLLKIKIKKFNCCFIMGICRKWITLFLDN